jgi:hypothetical protein
MRFTSKTPLTLQQIEQMAPSAVQGHAHSSRSSKYAFIPTLEIIKGMFKAGFNVFSASESRTRDESRRGFVKHMLRFRREGQTALAVGDSLPEVVLVNSHDGSSRYKLMAGIFRLVCSNGMIVADCSLASVSIKHMGDVVAEVVESANMIAEHSQQTFASINDWSRLQLTAGERSAFAEAAHAYRFADAEGKIDTPIMPQQLLNPRRREDHGNDLWKTFNTIQENLIKGGLHAVQYNEGVPVRNVSSRAVKSIDGDVKLNRALWRLAAELKAHKDGEAMAAVAGE